MRNQYRNGIIDGIIEMAVEFIEENQARNRRLLWTMTIIGASINKLYIMKEVTYGHTRSTRHVGNRWDHR